MITIDNLAFVYPPGKKIFSGLNLTLNSGSVCGLLGKNGAGKTTLLKLIAGLLFPAQGTCSTCGFSAQNRNPDMLKDLFFIPEELYIPPISAHQYESLYAPFYPRFDHTAFSTYCTDFELSTTSQLTTLSFGQKKKFLLAFGLATCSKVLILDEPTNGLDIPSKTQFRRIIGSISHPDRIVIISTHQVRDLENLLSTIIILDNSTIALNRHFSDISRLVSYSIEQSEPTGDQVLYSEKIHGGYGVLRRSTDPTSAPVDLEILFNAVISHSPALRTVLEQGAPL